ncbi:DUF559 domain-containing protein [Nonomuraea rhodomycinica]|uniref:DUF559 domain-containing protein n=1 Tax=Nonomuraea rhodomycinica TaxID=1712872 RepID=A0A7Y6IVI7_9ACTN|nr:DUF559 domain-containing protein [Nonomuraea rhodomycinica]NUW45172.1 DUF559 domain-containing protein [Nonomuraea rhodomycinica]
MTRAAPQAVACRQTAAHVWGLNALSPGATDADWPVELVAPGHLALPGCVTHVATLPPGDVTVHRGVRVTTPGRTALDCARWLPRLEAVAALDQFARRGVDLEELWRRAPSWHVRDTLALADRGAGSPPESWLRVILVDGGLPRPATQIQVPLPGDRHAYLDLGWKPYRLAVEYDGREHHSSAADRRRDDTRRAELRRQGWRVIPVRRDVIPARTAALLEHVANALIECGWRPTPRQTTRVLSRIGAARRRHRLPGAAASLGLPAAANECTPGAAHATLRLCLPSANSSTTSPACPMRPPSWSTSTPMACTSA